MGDIIIMARNVLKPNSGKKTKQTRTKSPFPSRIKAGERNIILTATCVLLGVMLWMHWTGCFNELKASNSSRFYIQNDQFGIKIPTLYPIQGIDISLHQGKIDWKKLDGCLSNNPSIQFVFIKATEGKTRKDPYFLTNWEEAGKIGLIRGAYHYLLPNKSGKMQAELFLKTVELSDGDLLPVCDVEITGGADAETIHQNVYEWLQTVESKIGKKPILYSSKRFYETYLAEDFSAYTLWIAHYHVPELILPSGDKWTIWQHSDRGRLKGIKRPVDFNVFQGTPADLDQLRI